MYKSKYDENDFKINLFNTIYNEDINKVKELVNDKMVVSNEFAAIPLNEHEDTPLHIASILGKEDIVKMLLKAGANPNCMDDIGYTPLRIACSLGNKNIVNILLKAGANPDDVNCKDDFHKLAEDDFYKLAKECRNGKFSSIDKFSFEKLIEFIDWKSSIKISDTNYNIDVVKLHLQDARNLKSFLETGKKELTEEQKEKLEQKLNKLNDMIILSLRDKTLLKYKEIYNDDNNEEYQILKEKLKVLPEIEQTELNEMLRIDTSYCDDIL